MLRGEDICTEGNGGYPMSPAPDDTPLERQSKGCNIDLKGDAGRRNKLNSKVQVIKAFHRKKNTY